MVNSIDRAAKISPTKLRVNVSGPDSCPTLGVWTGWVGLRTWAEETNLIPGDIFRKIDTEARITITNAVIQICFNVNM
jgi:hypothetical protein